MSEKEQAKKDGARLQKNSGRGKYSKGDARWPKDNPQYTVDYKEYEKSFTINDKVWAKAYADADRNGDEPVIKLTLNGRIDIAILDWETFKELVDGES